MCVSSSPSAVEPAAHLDPGPDGHDIYGPTGQALARVCVSLDPQTVLDNLQIEQSVKDGALHILKHCRSLLARYLSGSSNAGNMCSGSSNLRELSLGYRALLLSMPAIK